MTKQAIEKTAPSEVRRGDWFDRFFSDFPQWPALRSMWEHPTAAIFVEEKVEDGELVVRAELPGIDPDKDVNIHVRDHSLSITAERREETKSEEKGRYRSEFRYGQFSRVVPLPPDADESNVTATYKDGILEVRMPVDAKQAEAT